MNAGVRATPGGMQGSEMARMPGIATKARSHGATKVPGLKSSSYPLLNSSGAGTPPTQRRRLGPSSERRLVMRGEMPARHQWRGSGMARIGRGAARIAAGGTNLFTSRADGAGANFAPSAPHGFHSPPTRGIARGGGRSPGTEATAAPIFRIGARSFASLGMTL